MLATPTSSAAELNRSHDRPLNILSCICNWCLCSVGASGVRDIEANDLGKLSYMSGLIKEVLRACPPAPWGGNKVTVDEDTELCGYRVPKVGKCSDLLESGSSPFAYTPLNGVHTCAKLQTPQVPQLQISISLLVNSMQMLL